MVEGGSIRLQADTVAREDRDAIRIPRYTGLRPFPPYILIDGQQAI